MSCGEYDNYIITNGSDCKLIIKGFDRFRNAEAEIIILDSGEVYTVERYSGEGHDSRSFFSNSWVDSVRLEFNGEKVLLAVCDEEPFDCRNQFSCDDCYYNLALDNYANYTVVVTQEDCLNAEPM